MINSIKEHIINGDNLTKNDINEVVTRVKLFLINDKNELLLASVKLGCHLPGGHLEKNESLQECVKREIMEECGIVLDDSEIMPPFYQVSYYKKNYKNLNINRESKIVYYCIKTNKQPNIKNISLTENEKQNELKIISIPLNNLENYLHNIINSNTDSRYKTIANEILSAYAVLKEQKA